MKLDRRTVLSGTAAAFAVPFLGTQPARADAKRQSLVDACLATAQKILSGPDFPDAAKQMTTARGVLIIPELVQGGFIFGAAGGRGVLMGRQSPNNWSYPAFYGMGSGSVGLQVGGKVSEIVFIIRTEKGLQAILDHKFKVGAEAGVTLVAVGAGLEGASTAAGGADIVAFANSQGLFAGVSLEGSYIDADNDWNALYYGGGANAKTIISEQRFTNPGAEPIRQYLAKW
ncbi:MAG: lipid-binding SYLF domain-containing protein [Proteobacteria bacterium]|jgi:lipid-binding SYLF domain-containing protein|uniref:lipid-binding SYLF domain-containing protein n=1 Tax=Reyranella massiliensis TaxID=445220 RepID=UPI0002FA2A1F|nr:lipid-binding SYLF domain-containing protein [Reyranella massiliensis]MCA0246730.1 lipid-binding SYLF domain-containing protein [Pseudomonadota bacterium]